MTQVPVGLLPTSKKDPPGVLRYDSVYCALHRLSEVPLPDSIGLAIQNASKIMAALRTTGQELGRDNLKAWKLVKVMTAHQDAYKLIAIIDYTSKTLNGLPKGSGSTTLIKTCVSELYSATESFGKDVNIPETWKSEIEHRCPSELTSALKSPSATIVALLCAFKHSLTRLSIALSAWVQPLPIQKPTRPPGLEGSLRIARPTVRVGQFDTGNVRLSQDRRDDTFAEIYFPHTYIAPPRLPHGFCYLDADQSAGLHLKTTIENVQKASSVYHVTSWAGTILYRAVITSLNLAPASLDFLTGKHFRDLVKTPQSPTSTRIDFDRPFVTPPKVAVFFDLLDIYSKECRIRTTASSIDNKGFTLTIESWGGTILHCAQACWIAFPEDRQHIFFTSVNTKGVSSVGQKWGKDITLDRVKYWKTPEVFVALNELNFDEGVGPLRINAYVDNVTMSGLSWHIDTWDSSTLRSAGATIIAVN